MKTIPFLFLLILVQSCDSIDKMSKSQQIVNEVGSKLDCSFSVEVSEGTSGSEFIMTPKCDTNVLAFYSNALYQTIKELKRAKIEFDTYQIRGLKNELLFEIENHRFPILVNRIKHAEKIISMLHKKEHKAFLKNFKRNMTEIPDSSLLNSIHLNPPPLDVKFSGYVFISVEKGEFQGDFVRFYFINKKLEDIQLVMRKDTTDNFLYGIQY